MDATTYLAAWLLAALFLVGLITLVLMRYRRQYELRGAQARLLLLALQRYSNWVGAQRLAAVFQGEGPEAEAALDDACTIRMKFFPELAGDMAELMAVHNRLILFLSTQQALWLRDPENWLDSGHDKRFMALWRQHQYALQALHAKLQQVTIVRDEPPPPRRQSTYA
ncbi:MAG: hypothetical protein JWP65_1082 [Ramlibacter sp.]|jgi:hypothetical protein|uniref:hypothetical protein n=1 Tax=Ramlibacter sp. TaxID=1917967 RepID=UPI0026021027|nr:hypothetical protein [Ramlibacter sp.]MDB5750661.1 hypothetical protein [Ramlibacter sp.]